MAEALTGAVDSPGPIEYLELPATSIGAAPVLPSQWTTHGASVGVLA